MMFLSDSVIVSQPTSKAVPKPGCNVSGASRLLQRLLFYCIDFECRLRIQMRNPMRYRMHMHMLAEHTQCKGHSLVQGWGGESCHYRKRELVTTGSENYMS